MIDVTAKLAKESNDKAMEIARLKAENDKLREFARDMWFSAMQRIDYAERFAFAGDFVDRMRELEVWR